MNRNKYKEVLKMLAGQLLKRKKTITFKTYILLMRDLLVDVTLNTSNKKFEKVMRVLSKFEKHIERKQNKKH